MRGFSRKFGRNGQMDLAGRAVEGIVYMCIYSGPSFVAGASAIQQGILCNDGR